MDFEEALVAAMTAPISAHPDCMCQCHGGGIGRADDGSYYVKALNWHRIPMCPVHGVPARRRWWQTQKQAEQARLEKAAAFF